MDKKGQEVSVVLLVLLVFVLMLYTLYTFNVSKQKIEFRLADSDLVNGFYVKENLMKFYVDDVGEMAIRDAYSKVPLGGNLGGIFFSDVKNNFINWISLYEFEEDYIKDFVEKAKNPEISIDGNVVSIEIKDITLSGESENVKINYKPKIYVEFHLDEFN